MLYLTQSDKFFCAVTREIICDAVRSTVPRSLKIEAENQDP
jgi:hypothetical protein